MASMYRLILNSGPIAGKEFPMEKNELTIGRDLGNEVVISDAEVSRRHCRFFLQGNSYVIEDLGSTNGTSVNGQRLMAPYMLRPGEVITLGEHVTLLFEGGVPDSNATVVSGPGRPVYDQGQATSVAPLPPIAPPPVAPVYSNQSYNPPPPPPVSSYQPPAYSDQVPMPPSAPVAEKKKSSKLILIVILVLLLACICICIGGLYYIDNKNLWCQVMPFLPGCQ
jgi:predicted component of type VI protein secretion system